MAVRTATVGPWRIAVDAHAVRGEIDCAAVQWRGPVGRGLLRDEEGALPLLDLGVCWGRPPAASGSALVVQPEEGESPFALGVDAAGGVEELTFWPAPPLLRRDNGVMAAALRGVPWQAQTLHLVLLLDPAWLRQRLNAAEWV
jgi:chemotaxis protein histidine kinase CheA